MENKTCCFFGNLKNIVLVSDVSQKDDIVVETALRIAKCCGAVVHTLCYAEVSTALADVWESVPYVSDLMEKKIDTKLNEIKEKAKEYGVTVKGTCFVGEGPEDFIIKEAENLRADLIVMSRMRSPLRLLKKKIIGSAHCDVLIIPLDVSSFEIKKVLVASDGSLQSRPAVERALEMARMLSIPLVAISVAKRPENVPQAKAVVKEIESEATKLGVAIETEVLEGEPFRAILDRAERGDVGIVILGKYGRTGVEKLLIGSTSERVASFANIPILVATKRMEAEKQITPEQVKQGEKGARICKIVLATDGSHFSRGAETFALEIARSCSAQLYVTHVIVSNPEHMSMAMKDIETKKSAGREIIERVKREAVEKGVEVEGEVIVAREIEEGVADFAKKVGANLIVMGRRGIRGLSKFFIGSATLGILPLTPCPVLVVPKDAHYKGKGIVGATDGSDISMKALEFMADMAERMKLPVTVLTVAKEVAQKGDAEKALERARSLLKNFNIQADYVLHIGEPAKIILEVAKQRNADIIVLGSRGLKGLSKIILGSLSEKVLSESDRGVLIVRA